MEKKKSSITHIRSWVRTNGEMSEDGKSITYSCAELESVIREAKAMHKKEIEDALEAGYQIANEDVKFKHIHTAEQYYNEAFGKTKN